ncbi:DNA primase [Tautonia sociabilis]|uniref:DNA primase n=1 Tax=Tautonia sociabilis TaxID=2080755 RepID=A0A432MNK3_9BACT|nr:DNA primase [Tautonia sociabilis]RUL88829.1 DNA primase [Tautonia sociabilis]
MPRHSEATLAAIKGAIDIVSLIGEYLPLHRAGSKFKALCPFHDDHNPSLEINPERQTYKCWSCGAGGDLFDFVKDYERVEFPEALRMLAERAGVALETPSPASGSGPGKAELLRACAWAERAFRTALVGSDEARGYLQRRGLSAAMVERFGLGFAPDRRDWLLARGRREGVDVALLERAGLVSRGEKDGGLRDRFRGRVIFPIRDIRGRAIAFGGRILPSVEQRMAESGRGVAKYLNSPETPLFQKRRNLYAVDLAREAARSAGWVAVVEGYTDVVAAHQVGLANVVGTLGTALGDDHVQALRRLADRAVLVFDGDEAGQKAADRSLELFLSHEVDVRVLTLPGGQDPCDFLLGEGKAAFLGLVEAAADPLDYLVDRSSSAFDLDDVDGARRAAEAVLDVLARLPGARGAGRAGLDLKAAKALDRLAHRLRLPVEALRRDLAKRRRPDRPAHHHVQLGRIEEGPATSGRTGGDGEASPAPAIRPADLDPLDRELIEILLNEPQVVGQVITRVELSSLRSQAARAILGACYDLHGEGRQATASEVADRLEDPGLRALLASLVSPIDPRPLSERYRNGRYLPRPWRDRLAELLPRLAERAGRDRLRDLEGALAETDPAAEPETYRELWREKMRLMLELRRMVATKKSSDAS